MKGFLNEDRPVQTLRQVLTKLRTAYCSTTGYEVRRQAAERYDLNAYPRRQWLSCLSCFPIPLRNS